MPEESNHTQTREPKVNLIYKHNATSTASRDHHAKSVLPVITQEPLIQITSYILQQILRKYNFTSCFLWVWNLCGGFESGMPRQILKPKRDKTGQNCIMRNLIIYTLPNHHQGDSIEEGDMVGHVACMGVKRNT
jgi:hypothetical protein